MSYIPSPFDPRLADDAEACLGALLWRLLDASVGDDEALPEQPPLTAEDQALARVLEPLIEETSTCWRRRRDDALTRADVARTRDRVAAAAGSGSVAASLCGFLDDALALVGRLRPEEGETAERPWSRSLFDWTDDVPAGMPVVDLERAAGLSDAGWALYACASLHGLERWRHEAAAECLSLSRQAFVMAARLERWDVTLVHRGRHEAALAAVPDHGTAHAEHFILHNPNPIPDEIGRSWLARTAASSSCSALCPSPLPRWRSTSRSSSARATRKRSTRSSADTRRAHRTNWRRCSRTWVASIRHRTLALPLTSRSRPRPRTSARPRPGLTLPCA